MFIENVLLRLVYQSLCIQFSSCKIIEFTFHFHSFLFASTNSTYILFIPIDASEIQIYCEWIKMSLYIFKYRFLSSSTFEIIIRLTEIRFKHQSNQTFCF